MADLMPLEQAVDIVLDHMQRTDIEYVPLLESVGRVAALDIRSDIDVSSFAHSAMDGFALRAQQLESATNDAPVHLRVIAEVGAGSIYEGAIAEGECVRIMTGAALPLDADAVVKYEDVDVVEGDGKQGSLVSFTDAVSQGLNVRAAGEEAKAGEIVLHAGEVIGVAGVGALAGCGVLEVPTYRKPRVAIIATGSELVDPAQVPPYGKIRNSNSLAMAACVQKTGCIPLVFDIVEDTFEALEEAILKAIEQSDFVITTGGAADGDYDFIKPVADKLGEIFITSVNMRPGKAQTFAIVQGTPVFGLPGNPAAAYCGFQMILRPALRKMQGYTHFDYSKVQARLASSSSKKDPRRIYLRAILTKDETGYVVEPARNQSSGLFGVIQHTNCLAIMPEGLESKQAGDMVECLLLDVPEELNL